MSVADYESDDLMPVDDWSDANFQDFMVFMNLARDTFHFVVLKFNIMAF